MNPDPTFGDMTASHPSWASLTESYETFGDLTVADLTGAIAEMTVNDVADAYPSLLALSQNAPINPEEY